MMEESLTYNHRKRRSLRDFTRLSLAFYGCLCLLAAIQTSVLYWRGILDTFFSKSLWLLLVNHIGYSAMLVFILSFLFNALENKKHGLGFQVIRVLLVILLGVEALLTDYYLRYYELAGAGFVEIMAITDWNPQIRGILYLLVAIPVFHLIYRLMARSYRVISSMYPFTIVLFSLFIMTLVAQKKAVNKNKTQHLLVQLAQENLDMNQYEGNNPYPLFRPHLPAYSLSEYIQKGDQLPDIVVIVIEGWGNNFTGEGADYGGFTPFLDSLSQQSLYWENHLSNTGMGYAALPSVVGSMPFGNNGLTQGQHINGQTLPRILKESGYHTSFYYGGNTAIHHYDRFFTRENIDAIVDNKSFGDDYTKQQEDAAGISLGYPDKELFRRWKSDQHKESSHPRFHVIQTLSTAAPYLIPNQQAYLKKVDALAEGFRNTKQYKSIDNNRELFASMLYMDDALRQFFLQARNNTIYVLTGSHRPRVLTVESELSQYRVPLMIYSKDLKRPSKFSNLVSHMDITPSLLGYLHHDYRVQLPDSVAWLGGDLIYNGRFNSGKEIPLIRHRQNISDYIAGPYLVSGGNSYSITPQMELVEQDDDELEDHLLEKFRHFRAVNKYVCRKNMLIPADGKEISQSFQPSPEELVWIQSVFNGDNFDDAYDTARSLALKGNRERALLLGKYILTQVPGHADTEILMGRVEAWEGRYGPAAEFLEGAVQKYPVYEDAYAALLDLYFWNDKYQKTLLLEQKVIENGIESPELREKIAKVKQQLRETTLAEKAVL